MHNIFFFNRPLSPHLTIYSSQFTSIYSIWHRLTGISLLCIIIIFITFLKISMYIYTVSFFFNIHIWIKNSIYLNLSILYLYHMLNGIRHIIWDLGFFLSIKKINWSVKIINFILISYILFLIKKILV